MGQSFVRLYLDHRCLSAQVGFCNQSCLCLMDMGYVPLIAAQEAEIQQVKYGDAVLGKLCLLISTCHKGTEPRLRVLKAMHNKYLGSKKVLHNRKKMFCMAGILYRYRTSARNQLTILGLNLE